MNRQKTADFGTRIRQQRKKMGLTLTELAAKTELTPGFLGQVERGESNPSIDTFLKIAEALESPVSFFLWNEHDVDGSGLRPMEDEVLQQRLSDASVEIELFSRDFSRKMEIFRARMKPQTRREAKLRREPTEQIVYVLSGNLRISLHSGEHIVHQDDFIYFDGSDLRAVENESEEDTVYISVITPPIVGRQ